MLNAFLAGKKLMGGDYSQYTPSGKALLSKQGRAKNTPHVGDKVYFYSQSLGRPAHVGVVVSVEQSGYYYTIETVEGNTSAGKFDRNGGCVARKKYTFTQSEVGGTNRINCFVTPNFGEDTCTSEEFVKVACEEIGYEEKASNAGLEGKHLNVGKNNYTKYGAWYKESCGGDHPAYWCEQFMSWCAYMACKLYREKAFTGWIKRDGKWMYEKEGVILQNQWIFDGGRWYVVDGAGRMITGWFEEGDDWYYLNPDDGAMLSSQWIEVDGEWYYLQKSGLVTRNTYVKGFDGKIYYWVDANGVYQKDSDTESPDLSKYEVAE